MKYSTLVTARRKEEIYPPHVKWLAYDNAGDLVAYLDNDGQPVELEEFLSVDTVDALGIRDDMPCIDPNINPCLDPDPPPFEEDKVTPEDIVGSLSRLIAERNELLEVVKTLKSREESRAKVDSSVDTSQMEKRYMCSFSIRGDDEEFVYGLYSKKACEALLDRQRAKYGPDSISNVQMLKYYIMWEE